MKRRVCLIALLALPVSAADVSGAWSLEGEVAGVPIKRVCTIKIPASPDSQASRATIPIWSEVRNHVRFRRAFSVTDNRQEILNRFGRQADRFERRGSSVANRDWVRWAGSLIDLRPDRTALDVAGGTGLLARGDGIAHSPCSPRQTEPWRHARHPAS